MIYDYADYDNYDNSLHYSWIGIIRRIYEYPYYISTNSYEDDDNDNNYSVGDGSNDQVSDVIKNVNSTENIDDDVIKAVNATTFTAVTAENYYNHKYSSSSTTTTTSITSTSNNDNNKSLSTKHDSGNSIINDDVDNFINNNTTLKVMKIDVSNVNYTQNNFNTNDYLNDDTTSDSHRNHDLVHHHQQQQCDNDDDYIEDNFNRSNNPSNNSNNNVNSRIVEFLPHFNGDNHLDSLCCKYDLSYHEIISYPGIHLIYK